MILVALAATVGAGFYFYNHVNEEIRTRVEQKIAGYYPDLRVQVRSAMLVDGEGIEIRGLTISDPRRAGPAAELAYFDEIVLSCGTELQEFLQGEPQVQRIVIRRPRLRATRRSDGAWSVSQLMPLPQFSSRRVPIAVEGATIELVDVTKPLPSSYTIRDFNVQMQPVYATADATSAAIEFRGSTAGDHFGRIELTGRVEANACDLSLSGSIAGLNVSPELRDALPTELAVRLEPLAALRGECAIDFRVQYLPHDARPIRFELAGQLQRGRFDDARVPQVLTELAIDFRADNAGIVVDQLTAKSGNTSFKAHGKLDGLIVGAPMTVEVEANRLLIGRQWESFLTGAMLDTWRKFMPAGEVDAQLRLAFDGQKWAPELKLRCLNVSFTYYKFPYRFDRTSGTMTLKDQHLSMQLISYAGGRQVKIDGQIDNPGPQFVGAVDVQGTELPIDQNVLAALPAKAREVVTSLNPAGTVNALMRVERTDPRQVGVHQQLTVELNRCSVRYDKFPYPLLNVRGLVKMTDGAWSFHDLEGFNDSGRVTCRGSLRPIEQGTELILNFGGEGVVLEDELRDALPGKVQKVWSSLRPKGQVDFASQVNYLSASKALDVQIRAEPLGETASIEPLFFPYRMEKIRGLFTYREGRVDFEKVRAVHERTPIHATGVCEFDKQGNWRVRFERLLVDRLRADRDLLAALPGKLKRVVSDLSPTGPIHIDGKLELSGSADPKLPLQSSWDLNFDLRQSSLNCGVPIEHVDGKIWLAGEHDGQALRSRGGLDIDNLTYKDFQFTEIRGPIWIDDKQLIFGSQAIRREANQPPQRATAKLYGGTVLADLWVGEGSPCRYLLQATLTDGDLQRFARDQLPGKQKLKGKVEASVDLSGEGTGLHTLGGKGQVRLREADIYELPVMVALLKILSIRQPDTKAFTTSDVDFRIDGEHVYLDKIEFSGDAISLVGNGEMNLDTEIRATLSAIVGRSELQVPVLRDMLGAIGQQFLQIHVGGNLADPQIRREALPGLNQTLQTLGSGMFGGSSNRGAIGGAAAPTVNGAPYGNTQFGRNSTNTSSGGMGRPRVSQPANQVLPLPPQAHSGSELR